jgi:hypothetical protein
MDESGSSKSARRMGELEGAAFEGALAARERAERSDRLSRITLAGDEADLPIAQGSHSGRDRAEMESRLRDLSHFHTAVVSSRSWQLLQKMRGLFGRAW